MSAGGLDGRASTVRIGFALALTALFTVACGKKGDPQAPLPRGPRAVSDLAVEQEGDDAVLTFSFPDRLLTGAPHWSQKRAPASSGLPQEAHAWASRVPQPLQNLLPGRLSAPHCGHATGEVVLRSS